MDFYQQPDRKLETWWFGWFGAAGLWSKQHFTVNVWTMCSQTQLNVWTFTKVRRLSFILSLSQTKAVSSWLTTFHRSLTMQFGGRMSACSDVPFMLALSWRPGTRHCICQPDRTRAAPSLNEPFIWGGGGGGHKRGGGEEGHKSQSLSNIMLALRGSQSTLSPVQSNRH